MTFIEFWKIDNFFMKLWNYYYFFFFENFKLQTFCQTFCLKASATEAEAEGKKASAFGRSFGLRCTPEAPTATILTRALLNIEMLLRTYACGWLDFRFFSCQLFHFSLSHAESSFNPFFRSLKLIFYSSHTHSCKRSSIISYLCFFLLFYSWLSYNHSGTNCRGIDTSRNICS